MATLKDIALRAGVTHSIVSRVLTGDPTLRVSPDTRSLIQKVADELDYVPNESARSLRKARPQAIAMAMHDITNPVFTQIFVGAQEEADARDHMLFVSEVSALASGNARLGKLIRGGAIDGVILLGLGTQQDATVREIVIANARLVCLQDEPNADYGVVRIADQAGTMIATRHLLDLGHSRIGMLATSSGAGFSQRRVAGWQQAMVDAGTPPPSWYEQAGSDIAAGETAVMRLMQREPGLTAIVVANVMSAIGALAGLHAIGKRVPEDVSVISLLDTPFAGHTNPALTTVDMPLAQLGREAVRLLLAEEQPAGRQIDITSPEPRLVIRSSTAPPSP
ncbi:LacI family DNA-binding transcriptional regulator [Devosia ginsengisoli]|uniref:LacI family transcriptional regulator n=1 Tax=Devosia ginsengisoli TaxID=400770 RepID=A0A5B8LUE5_9HYPH|nr:LacI family DNA-binding transcriptional regulator [Devosia ginsengisoli]QDZ11656.1 LacI family transcriptional regulator [Devosia ginsengisoli]